MTNVPSLYDFKGHSIRVVQIDDAPWFVAADICKAINVGSVTNATSILDQINVRNLHLGQGRARPKKIITEAGLYKIIMRSDKAEAKEFQEWVAEGI